MFKGKLTIFLAILLIADAAIYSNNQEGSEYLPAGTVSLIADNGQALKLCNNCGKSRVGLNVSASVSPY